MTKNLNSDPSLKSEKKPEKKGDPFDPSIIAPLLARAKKGESSAFNELIEVSQTDLFRFCLFLSGSHALANDLLQDTFIKVLEKVETIEDPGAFKSWLFKTAKNNFLMFLRSPRNRDRVDFEDGMVENQSDSQTQGSIIHGDLQYKNDISVQVQEVLMKLKAEDRMLLVLVDVEEYSYPEAAEIIGISESALRSRLHRARQAFIKIFEGA